MKEATDALWSKCNFMIILSGNAISGQINDTLYIIPLKVLTIKVMYC